MALPACTIVIIFLQSPQQTDYRSIEGMQLDCLQKGVNGLGEKDGAQVTGGFNGVKIQ